MLLLAQAGDQAAFAALWQRLTPRLRRLLGGMAGPGAEAEELMQETSLQLFRSLPRYRDRGRGPAVARAWIYRLAVNVALMHQRRARRRPHLALGEGFAGLAVQASSPEHRASLREQGRDVDLALEALPDKYRLVLWLADVEGQRMEDVAEILGITLPTAKARLLRARATVRASLGKRRVAAAPHRLAP